MRDLLALLGRVDGGGEVLVVTNRGVEIPIRAAHGWDIATLSRALTQIDSLPETPERDA